MGSKRLSGSSVVAVVYLYSKFLVYVLSVYSRLRSKPLMTAHAGEDVEKGEHSSIAGASANWYSRFGNQYGEFSENWDSIDLKTQQYHL